MGWDSAPPSQAELQLARGSWDAEPPSRHELLQAGEKPEVSKLESLARGGAQSATLGFADEATGGIEALWKKAKGDPRTFHELYKQARDESRENYKLAQEANPKSYIAGEIAGVLPTLLIPGSGEANAVREIGTLAKIGKTAASGAKIGAAAGLGNSEADLTDGKMENYVQAAKDTARGGTVGAVIAPVASAALENVVVPGLVKGAEAIGAGAQKVARSAALRGVGARIKDMRQMYGKGNADEIADHALEHLQWGDTVDKINDRFADRVEQSGDKLDEIYGKAGNDVSKIVGDAGFDPSRDKNAILAAATQALGDHVDGKAAIQKLSNYLDEVAERHGDQPNAEALARYKQQIAEYLPKYKNYLAERAKYRAQLGQAGNDAAQPALPGMADDLQRTQMQPAQIEVNGQPASVAQVPPAIPSEQTYLSPLPQKDPTLFNPAGGDNLLPLNQQMALDDMSKAEISSLGKQAEFTGLENTPRSYAQVERPGIVSRQGQTEMAMEPQSPMRPEAPNEVRNPMTPRRAADIKTAMDQKVNYARNPLQKDPAGEQAFHAARQAVAKKVDESIEQMADKGLAAELKAANKQYGLDKTIKNMAQDQSAREASHQMFGLTELMVAGPAALADAASHGGLHGAAAFLTTAVGTKAVKKYGASTIAKAMSATANTLMKTPALAKLAAEHPETFQAQVINLTRRMVDRGENLPAAAASNQPAQPQESADNKPATGPDKWADDGLNQVLQHEQLDDNSDLDLDESDIDLNGADTGAMLSDPKAKRLLIQASSLKPGSKAMVNVVAQLKNHLKSKAEA
jgi:hypothetical protein